MSRAIFKEATNEAIKGTIKYVELNLDEEKAVGIVLNIIEANELNATTIYLERKSGYLLVVSREDFHLFRLKFTGEKHYIACRISGEDAKALKNDVRFANIVIGKHNFDPIPINDVHDIKNYSDLIIMAYNYAISSYNKLEANINKFRQMRKNPI